MNDHASAKQTALLSGRPKKQNFFDISMTIQKEEELNPQTCRDTQTYKRTIDYSLVVLTLLFLPCLIWGSDYGAAELKTEANKLQTFLYGPVMRMAGVVGSVFGIVRAFQTQSLQPLFIFGGIGVATVIVPKLLDSLFGKG